MIVIRDLVSRSSLVFTALAFGAALVVPVLLPSAQVGAVQVTSRKLTMASTVDGNTSTDIHSVAVAAGAPGNGAQTTHTFNYTHPGSPTIAAVALQYCTTPLIGADCVAPTGLDVSTVTAIGSEAGYAQNDFAINTSVNATQASGTGYFATDDNSCDGSGVGRTNCILISDPGTFGAGTSITLVFGSSGSWIKNPTANGNFYVRILTFSDNTFTTLVDDGAVAGSVNEEIDITARVQEKLNFSVSGVYGAPNSACDALTGSGAILLGDSQGILDSGVTHIDSSYFRLSTNASGGTLVQYSGDTLKTAGGDLITALTTTPAAAATNTQQFGLNVDATDGNYSFTNLTRSSPYANGATTFAFDTTSVTTPRTVASAASGTIVSCDTGVVDYVGNITTTTKAGQYKTRIVYFATPTF